MKKRNKKYNAKRIEINASIQAARSAYMAGCIIPLLDEQNKPVPLEFVAHLDFYQERRLSPTLKDYLYLYPNDRLHQGFLRSRHTWTIGIAILNRDSRNKVYLSQMYDFEFQGEYYYSELEETLATNAANLWEKANPDYRLAICFCISAVTRDFDNEAYLQAVYYRDVLARLSTKHEREQQKDVQYYNATNFTDFLHWFNHQKGKGALKLNGTTSINETNYYPDVEEKVVGRLCTLHVSTEYIPERAINDTLRIFAKRAKVELNKSITHLSQVDELPRLEETIDYK